MKNIWVAIDKQGIMLSKGGDKRTKISVRFKPIIIR